MVFADGALSDPATQLAWGGNLGTITTNGEWWRLLAATFIHSGLLQLVVNMTALAQVGLVFERLVGHSTFALVYLTAAVIGSAMDLYAQPLSISTGPSAAIMAIYGLMAGATVWNLLQQSAVTIPPKDMIRFAPVGGIFLLYTGVAHFAKQGAGGFAMALAGLALTRGIGEHKPSLRLVGPAAAAALVLAVVFAIPLRGISTSGRRSNASSSSRDTPPASTRRRSNSSGSARSRPKRSP